MPHQLTELVNLKDGDGDSLSLLRLDRPTGSRAYMISINTSELCGSVFLTTEHLHQIKAALAAELGYPQCVSAHTA